MGLFSGKGGSDGASARTGGHNTLDLDGLRDLQRRRDKADSRSWFSDEAVAERRALNQRARKAEAGEN